MMALMSELNLFKPMQGMPTFPPPMAGLRQPNQAMPGIPNPSEIMKNIPPSMSGNTAGQMDMRNNT